jgi:hypothetical protein
MVEFLEDPAITILGVYVDDIVIMAPTIKMVKAAKDALSSLFKIKDNGALSAMLGMEFTSVPAGLFCHQHRYVLNVLDHMGLARSNQVIIPMHPHSVKLLTEQKEFGKPYPDTPYRSSVGELLYLAVCTRPDISFAVNMVARFVQKPHEVHWSAVKQIARYLIGTPDTGLLYRNSGGPFRLYAYSDSDFATDRIDSKSTSGHVVMLNESCVAWKSAKQKCVSTSSVEAEYIAACAAAKDVTWLHMLLKEVTGIHDIEVPYLRMDSSGAEAVIKYETISNKTKHVRYTYHFIRDLYMKGDIFVEHVPGVANPADALTKPVDKLKHKRHIGAIYVSTLKEHVS